MRDLLDHQRFRGAELYRSLRDTQPDAECPFVVVNVMQGDSTPTFGDCTGVVRQLAVGPVRGLSFDFYGGDHRGTSGLEVRATTSALRADVDGHRYRLSAFIEAALGDKKTMAAPIDRFRLP